MRAKLPALSATDYSFSREASVGSYSRLSAFAADDQKAMQRLVRSSAMGPGKTVNGQEKIDRANLARAFVAYGQPKFRPAAQSFSDVSGSSTLFLESCAGARSLGRALFGSYAEGPILTKLEPKTTVTRLEYAKAVVRFAGLEEEARQRNGAILPFDDASLLSTQDRGYMAVALDRRLLDPVGTRLDPSGSLTSLMLARGLYRLD